MAGSLAQLAHPFLEHARRHHLADAVVARGEIGRAEHAELLDEVGEAAAIDHHGNGRAGTGLLQHVLVGAELRVGEQLDLDRAVRALGHRVAEALQPLVKGISGRQRRVDAQSGGRNSDAAQQNHGRRCRRAQYRLEHVFPPFAGGVCDIRLIGWIGWNSSCILEQFVEKRIDLKPRRSTRPSTKRCSIAGTGARRRSPIRSSDCRESRVRLACSCVESAPGFLWSAQSGARKCAMPAQKSAVAPSVLWSLPGTTCQLFCPAHAS